jgi:hypothetical protein
VRIVFLAKVYVETEVKTGVRIGMSVLFDFFDFLLVEVLHTYTRVD